VAGVVGPNIKRDSIDDLEAFYKSYLQHIEWREENKKYRKLKRKLSISEESDNNFLKE